MHLVSQITIFHPEDMILLGYYTAQILLGNELICLEGELGTGKTTFTKGFGKAFCIQEDVVSPSFVLLREYKGTKLLLHYDLYRLTTNAQLLEIDFFDHMGRDGIKIVEWADKFPEINKYADWVIKFKNLGEDIRLVEFYATSA